MAAPIGNNYWQFRNKHGRDYKYTPDLLWDEFKQYSQWVENNPLFEEKGFAFQGIVTKERFAKMRVMTQRGFCVFADLSQQTYNEYRNNKDFTEVITRIDDAIYLNKFEGAAAELVNPNIIARDLGLTDQQQINHQNNGGKFEPTFVVNSKDTAEGISKLLNGE
jgi:hypothetical protein